MYARITYMKLTRSFELLIEMTDKILSYVIGLL